VNEIIFFSLTGSQPVAYQLAISTRNNNENESRQRELGQRTNEMNGQTQVKQKENTKSK
jgi:hypothetical protein